MDRVQMVNNRNMLIASLLLLSLGTMPVYADGAGIEWDILNQEVTDLYQQGEYARAVVVAKEAIDVAVENIGLIFGNTFHKTCSKRSESS